MSCLTLVTPYTVALQAPLSMGFSRPGYWRGCHFFLQGIFLTQGSSQSPSLAGDSLALSHRESSKSNFYLRENTTFHIGGLRSITRLRYTQLFKILVFFFFLIFYRSKIGSNTLQHSGKNKRNYCGGLRVKIIFSTYKHGDCFPLG